VRSNEVRAGLTQKRDSFARADERILSVGWRERTTVSKGLGVHLLNLMLCGA